MWFRARATTVSSLAAAGAKWPIRKSRPSFTRTTNWLRVGPFCGQDACHQDVFQGPLSQLEVGKVVDCGAHAGRRQDQPSPASNAVHPLRLPLTAPPMPRPSPRVRPASINAPGGEEGIQRLAEATGLPAAPLNPDFGLEGSRYLAVIDEGWCIGCTLCIKACPVDCIIGAPKHMHTVVEDQCTGCELCIPVCPVDCISLVPAHKAAPRPQPGPPGAPPADEARDRHAFRTILHCASQSRQRRTLASQGRAQTGQPGRSIRLTEPAQLDQKRAVIEAALARARARRQTS